MIDLDDEVNVAVIKEQRQGSLCHGLETLKVLCTCSRNKTCTNSIIIVIITDSYEAPFLSRAHSALQRYTTSTTHNAQATIASNHV